MTEVYSSIVAWPRIGRQAMSHRKVPPRAILQAAADQGLSLRQMSEKFDVCYDTLKNAMRHEGISYHRPSDGRFIKGQHWRHRQPFWDKEWLAEAYVVQQRSAQDIATEFGITEAAIFHWLQKHGIPRRSIAESRAIKHWGSVGENNPMFGKRGAASTNWKGGRTPLRQRIYSSMEWHAAEKIVMARDKGTCQRCGRTNDGEYARIFPIHHIVHYTYLPLTTEPTNLVTLCWKCHRWVHTPARNINQEYLLPIPS
jgi:HNH endonuclease